MRTHVGRSSGTRRGVIDDLESPPAGRRHVAAENAGVRRPAQQSRRVDGSRRPITLPCICRLRRVGRSKERRKQLLAAEKRLPRAPRAPWRAMCPDEGVCFRNVWEFIGVRWRRMSPPPYSLVYCPRSRVIDRLTNHPLAQRNQRRPVLRARPHAQMAHAPHTQDSCVEHAGRECM